MTVLSLPVRVNLVHHVLNGAIPLCMHKMVALLGGGKKGGGVGPSWKSRSLPVLFSAWLLPIFPLSLLPIF